MPAHLVEQPLDTSLCRVSRRPNIAVAKLAVTEGRVVLVNSDRAVSAHRWLSPRTDGGAFTFSGSAPEMIFGESRDIQVEGQTCAKFIFYVCIELMIVILLIIFL